MFIFRKVRLGALESYSDFAVGQANAGLAKVSAQDFASLAITPDHLSSGNKVGRIKAQEAPPLVVQGLPFCDELGQEAGGGGKSLHFHLVFNVTFFVRNQEVAGQTEGLGLRQVRCVRKGLTVLELGSAISGEF
ncbi:MAG: hypothetical protein KDB07_04715, partial [Planctomycetes bacterium]|nr:hypothetical protein [Planctomycetota bacterium]